jgi:hypothetical protein
MTAFLDFLSAAAKIWGQHPVEFAGAALVGILIGYFLSRLRHQGTIDAQKAHIAMNNESMKTKDIAIAAGSAAAPRLEIVGSTNVLPLPVKSSDPVPLPAPETKAAPLPSKDAGTVREDPRFREINSRVIADTEEKIYKAIRSTVFRFVFNPETGQHKDLTFKEGGWIGEGSNKNETRWRVTGGRLEILNSRDEVYSRFFLMPDGRSMHHTNDPDTKSIKGQVLMAMPRG